MKVRSFNYLAKQLAGVSEPRYVVSIEFGAADLEYFSSHSGITDIPAGTFNETLADFSAVSQSVDPDTGTSRIGSLTVMLADVGEVITDEIQARLSAGDGLRDKIITLWKGFDGLSFNDFEKKYTQQIVDVVEDRSRYSIRCMDLQRSMRSQILELKETILDATLSASATSMTVTDSTDFITVAHGSSYSHGPSATWGYVKVDDEIIGYTGKTATTLTGLDRGLFNTAQVEHLVAGADPPERRPAVTEVVYLEMPIPKLVKAIMTGVLHGQAANLPAHWHLGIDPALVDDSQFTSIGVDLWDPANDAVGLVARFLDIESIDGKRFLETECLLMAQIFSPVLSDGKLGLKRLTPALAGAAHVADLHDQNVVKHGALSYLMSQVINRCVINWSWIAGKFRRSTIKIDATSISTHGAAPIKTFNFRGLASNIATDTVIEQRFDAIRDRFSSPPLSISVEVFKYLDSLEIGDVVRLDLPNVRDMTAASVNPIDRSFEVRQIAESRTQPVKLSLIGSSAKPTIVAPAATALPDAYYNQAGTELSTVVTIVAGVTSAGTFSLTGNASMNSAIFYYVGDLTIGASTTINIDKNVQLRIRGHLTINGVIDGAGDGLAGVADTAGIGTGPGGTAGYFGATAGGNGVNDQLLPPMWISRPPDTGITIGEVSSLPMFNLIVNGNALEGVPDDLQGTSGGPGGKLVDNVPALEALGGTGGAGGAGLMIVSRGLSFGGSGQVDLDGAAGSAGIAGVLSSSTSWISGDGAGGAPGAFLVLLDGNELVPDLTGKFSAIGGSTFVTGTPIANYEQHQFDLIVEPATGFFDRRTRIDSRDYFDAAYRIQFVPITATPVEDLPDPGLEFFYIKPTNGTALRNGTGTLTIEAHRVHAGADELLSIGTVKLYDPGGSAITAANGYVAGSDGFTGILNTGDITGDIVISLRDGPAGTVYDSITLVDIDDGLPGADGDDAVSGFIEPENGLAWARSTNEGNWTPSQETTDLDVTFVQGGVTVCKIARRITLNPTDGTLTVSTVAHKDVDLNLTRCVPVVSGSGTTAVTVEFPYVNGADAAGVSETIQSAQSGNPGSTFGGTGVTDWETYEVFTGSPYDTALRLRVDWANARLYVNPQGRSGAPAGTLNYRYEIEVIGANVTGLTTVSANDTFTDSTPGDVTFNADNADEFGANGVKHNELLTINTGGEDEYYLTLDALTVTTQFRIKIYKWDNGLGAISLGNKWAQGITQIDTVAETFVQLFFTPQAGQIIIWKGSLASAPSNPLLNWGYYNTTTNVAEIWDGDTWETLSQDGSTGLTGADGVDAVVGVGEPNRPTAWTREVDGTTWDPSTTTVDWDVKFLKDAVDQSRHARRITRDADGLLTVATTTHKSGNKNTGRLTDTVTGSGTRSINIQIDYLNGNDKATISQTFTSILSSPGAIIGDIDDFDITYTDAVPNQDGYLRVASSGDLRRQEGLGNGYVTMSTWLGAGLNSDFDCKLTKIAGDSPNGTSTLLLNTWYIPTSNRTWRWTNTATNGNKFGTFQLTFRRLEDRQHLSTIEILVDISDT